MEPIRLDDDGMITVEIGDAVAQLDLWLMNDKLYELTHAEGKSSEQIFEGILDLMESNGLPRGSHRLADKFSKLIFQTVIDLKKNDMAESTPGSPASTVPALSD